MCLGGVNVHMTAGTETGASDYPESVSTGHC